MRVLLIHQSAELYGSDRSFISSCKAFRERGDDVTILLPCDGPLVQEVSVYGRVEIFEFGVLRKVTLKKSPFKDSMRLLRGIFYTLKRIKDFDLIYVNTIVNIPFLISSRYFSGGKILHVREMPDGIAGVVFRWLIRYSRMAIIYNSKAVKDRIGLPGKVVYNGINLSSAISSVDNYKAESPAVLFVGRLNEWKGADLLLESCRLLDQEAIIGRIDIVGEHYPGQEYSKERICAVANNIHNIDINFHGFQSNTAPFYMNADVVVVPSRNPEPFGRVVIEAMAFGCTVIIAGHGGMLEIIEGCNKKSRLHSRRAVVRCVVLSGVLLSGVVLYSVVFWCAVL